MCILAMQRAVFLIKEERRQYKNRIIQLIRQEIDFFPRIIFFSVFSIVISREKYEFI